MDDREVILQNAVDKLKEIESVDDFKAAKDEIMDAMEAVFKSAVDTLKGFFEAMLSLDPEKVQEQSQQFQDPNFMLPAEIQEQMQRLDAMPGGVEYGDVFGAEMEKRVGPYMQEYAEQMGKLMENLMGGLMGGVADAMSEAGAGAGYGDEEEEDRFEFDSSNPDTPDMLYELYMARDLEYLMDNTEYLIETVEDRLQNDIWDMEVFADPNFAEARKENEEKIQAVRQRFERIEPEVEKEFARIAALPEAAEKANEIKQEFLGKVEGKMKQLKELLDQLK